MDESLHTLLGFHNQNNSDHKMFRECDNFLKEGYKTAIKPSKDTTF